MKKMILTILGLMAFTTIHAQSVVVVKQEPCFLGGVVDAVISIAAAPFYLGAGILEGTAESLTRTTASQTKVVVVQPGQPTVLPHAAPAPVIVPPPVVTVSPSPVVVVPAPAPKPVVAPTTTITTRYDDGSVVQVTRQASAYELGPGKVMVPVDPDHRVGSSPFVNPYVFRYR